LFHGHHISTSEGNIWKRINEDTGEILPSIQIILEQQDLIERSNEAIEQLRK